HCSAPSPSLPSFPTRRSSDLIENYQQTIRNMGKAGIPLLGYHWMPNGVWRTPNAAGRGGVRVTAFDMALAGSTPLVAGDHALEADRKSTRLNSSHLGISYAVF